MIPNIRAAFAFYYCSSFTLLISNIFFIISVREQDRRVAIEVFLSMRRERHRSYAPIWHAILFVSFLRGTQSNRHRQNVRLTRIIRTYHIYNTPCCNVRSNYTYYRSQKRSLLFSSRFREFATRFERAAP